MQILSVKEASAFAGVHRNTIRNWIAAKKFQTVEHDGQTGIPLPPFVAFVAEWQGVEPSSLTPPKQASSGATPAQAKPAAKPKLTAADVPDGSGPLTVKQAAALAGVSDGMVYFWFKDQKFPTIKKGNSRLIPRKGFEKFLATYKRQNHPTSHARKAEPAAPTALVPVSTTAPATAIAPASADEFVSVPEAARLAKVDPKMVYNWIHKGHVSAARDGRKVTVERAGLLAYLGTYKPRNRTGKRPRMTQAELPFSAIRELARSEERASEFGGRVPKAEHLNRLDMAEQISEELGRALANFRIYTIRKFLEDAIAKLDAEP